MAMMLLFANCSPYLSGSDDVLAQFCQFSLTFALTIGLLEKASDAFQDPLFGTHHRQPNASSINPTLVQF